MNPSLPWLPIALKPAAPTSNLIASRLMPSYYDDTANRSPATLLTRASDEDECPAGHFGVLPI